MTLMRSSFVLRWSHRFVASSLLLSLLCASALTMGASQPALARTLNNVPQSFYPGLIADVAETVAPSVVNIDIEKTARASVPDLSGLPFSEDILRRFFGVDPGSGPFTPFGGSSGAAPKTIMGNGSGMIISQDG